MSLAWASLVGWPFVAAFAHRPDISSCPVSSFNVQQLNMIDALLQLGQVDDGNEQA
jgi:hypothetical protein